MNTVRDATRFDRQDGTLPASGEVRIDTFVDRSHAYRGRNLPNAMSVDVEDYFQVSAFENHISRGDWDRIPARLPHNIARILEMFEEQQVKATFFTLGWVCEKHPAMIREIVAAGHELASHGHDHARVWNLGRARFLDDVRATRERLEDLSGQKVSGYRAPSFSIGQQSLWAYAALQEAGYVYSSSVFPIRHDHYGLPGAPRFPFLAGAGGLLEIPMSSVKVMGRNWPCSGGGYFRLFPLAYSKWAMHRINRQESMPAIFYFHPWEIDPEQPRVAGLPARTRFRHYVNLGAFEARLRTVLKEFRWGRMDEIFLDSAS